MSVVQNAKDARSASRKLMAASLSVRNNALEEIASSIKKNSKYMIEENAKDLKAAEKLLKKNLLETSLFDRLKLSEDKISALCNGILELTKMEDPINRITYSMELDKDLNLYRTTCPIGVIFAIFEARPDALVQIAALCMKSGNAVLLKGGSEALNTNAALMSIIRKATNKFGLPEGWISIIQDRKEADEALKLNEYIDLVVARGGRNLVEHVLSNTRIPVLGHTEGLCHIYVEKSANIENALDICVDAKTNYPAACNSVRFVLVDKEVAEKFLPELVERYAGSGVSIKGSEEVVRLVSRVGIKNVKIMPAIDEDWHTEFLDMTVAIRMVDGPDDAVSWINEHSSRHTDAIVTENMKIAKDFAARVDSSSVMINASTRFSDGYRYGFGAEVGISTSKVHARGPVGIEGLVTYKYVLVGKGQIVGKYTQSKDRRQFTHRSLDRKEIKFE